MARNTFQTCEKIVEKLLENSEIRISRNVKYDELKRAVEILGGSSYVTVRRYVGELVRLGFLKKEDDFNFEILERSI